MRDFETLAKEAKTLQSEEEERAWFEELALEERLVFLQKFDPDCVTFMEELLRRIGIDLELEK